MKNLLLIALTLFSVSAWADAYDCKQTDSSYIKGGLIFIDGDLSYTNLTVDGVVQKETDFSFMYASSDVGKSSMNAAVAFNGLTFKLVCTKE